MSWGTSVDAEIYFSRKTYRDRYDMEQDMKEQEHVMDMAKNNLMIYAASDPKMFRATTQIPESSDIAGLL